MQNLMILGANIQQVPLIRQALADGYATVVVSPQPDEPGFEYATHPVYVDVRDMERVLHAAREYNIVGIITDQAETPVRTVAYVAEEMGLPGIGLKTARLFTDKFMMRERCSKLGIPTPAYAKAESIEEATAFFESLGGDAIIKPVDSQGSKGVLLVRNSDELRGKFCEALSYSHSGAVIIEQFIEGREFVVEGLAFDYEFINLTTGDTYYFDIPDLFAPRMRVFPSSANSGLIGRIEELNKRIITEFGFRQGITHSEFIVTEDEKIYLIETAARGGGVFISSDLISLSTGLNTEEFLIRIATGRQRGIPEISSRGLTCCYIAFILPAGEIISINGIDEIKAMPFTHRHNLDLLRVGSVVKPYKDKTARGFIIVSGRSHEELEEHIRAVREVLDIRVGTGEGIKGPIWE